MPQEKGKQLNFDDRCLIEEMLKDNFSFGKIALRAEHILARCV